ncbi:hypothetical protein HK096_004515 [Nowakowskiella sp. JEL0078]|nr:hypothetical protein HK096_004515 [Nowakowskiella sp. JEL0078]
MNADEKLFSEENQILKISGLKRCFNSEKISMCDVSSTFINQPANNHLVETNPHKKFKDDGDLAGYLAFLEKNIHVSKTSFIISNFFIVDCYRFKESAFSRKPEKSLKIRSFFVLSDFIKGSDDASVDVKHDNFLCEIVPKILLRGYDKFFEISFDFSKSNCPALDATVGPFEVSLKENGCLICVSAYMDTIFVSSKNSLISDHSKVASELLEKILNSNGSKAEFINFLQERNVTLLFEFCDDSFEEHVLAYPPELAGLYLHGINENTLKFDTWSRKQVDEIANRFGFKSVRSLVFDTPQGT